GAGCEVIDIGIAPTPTCGRAVRELGAAGGVQITASHNPAPWNGLKLFGPDGAVLPAAEGRRVQERYENGELRRAAWDEIGATIPDDDTAYRHPEAVLGLLDAQLLREAETPVLLDGNGGAGGPLALHFLKSLGCRIPMIAC